MEKMEVDTIKPYPDNKLGMCNVCTENLSKYKCPKCETNSCSLECVKKHKTDTTCSGVRDRVKMIPKENMDNFTLLSDYRFLEEIDHKLDDGFRNPVRKSIPKRKETLQDLPFHLQKLKTEARKRGTVLEYMPKYFSIHQENTTRFSFSDKKIRWHLKWVFPQAGLSFTEKSVHEDSLVLDIIQKYMEPPNRLDDEPSSLSQEELEKLSYYQSASYRHIAVLFKSQLCNYDKKFIELSLSKSLKTNLVNRKVIEYPIFFVVLRDHLDAFIEDESETEEGNHERINDEKNLTNLNKDLRNKLKVNESQRKRLNFFESYSDLSEDSD